MEIPEKPDRPICSTHGPLVWGYFTDTRQGARWLSLYLTGDGSLMPHLCFTYDPVPLRWEPSPERAEIAHRGAALARQVLAAKGKTLTEEK